MGPKTRSNFYNYINTDEIEILLMKFETCIETLTNATSQLTIVHANEPFVRCITGYRSFLFWMYT